MATALAATFTPGTTTAPACTVLQVTGAPYSIPAYVSAFTTSVDGWAADGTGTMVYAAGPAGIALELRGDVGATNHFTRTVTGLTIGQAYTFTAMVLVDRGTLAMTVTGKATGSFQFAGSRASMSYTFTATATSHVIDFQVKAPKGTTAGTTNGVAQVDTVKVVKAGTWQGTTITRTDANGTAVPVRVAPGGQDTDSAGTMTVTDYEAALVGTVTYAVVDGNGAVATTTLTNPAAPGVWVTLPGTGVPGGPDATAPLFAPVDMVTGYDEASDTNGSLHRVIGRRDLIGNPGPLVLRTGQFVLWCRDYATAAATRELLTSGDTAQLRQVDHPGMDAYFTATGVSIAPEQLSTPQRWGCTIRYQEQLAPPTATTSAPVLDGGSP